MYLVSLRGHFTTEGNLYFTVDVFCQKRLLFDNNIELYSVSAALAYKARDDPVVFVLKLNTLSWKVLSPRNISASSGLSERTPA